VLDASWSGDSAKKEQAAIDQIAQKTGFMDKLCAGGPITISLNANDFGRSGEAGTVFANKKMTIYAAGVNVQNAHS